MERVTGDPWCGRVKLKWKFVYGVLCIKCGGILFPHKMCHTITWMSPDLQTENQIDHLVIKRMCNNLYWMLETNGEETQEVMSIW
jgi:hypothetical protein